MLLVGPGTIDGFDRFLAPLNRQYPRWRTSPGLALSGIGAERTLIITPARNQNGTATLRVQVSDPAGVSATDEFDVHVNPVNDDPVLDLLAAYEFGPTKVHVRVSDALGAMTENPSIIACCCPRRWISETPRESTRCCSPITGPGMWRGPLSGWERWPMRNPTVNPLRPRMAMTSRVLMTRTACNGRRRWKPGARTSYA
jgi:hypothetical protein